MGERELTVAGVGEFLVGRVGAFLVGALGADLGGHGGGLQVGDVGFRGAGVGARGADVVDVEVGGLGEGALDAVVAGVVGRDAGGVGAGRGGAGLQRRHALLVVGGEVGGALGGADERPVGVGVGVVDVGFVLEDRVEPAVVDAEGDERDGLAGEGAGVDGGVLLLEVVREFRAVVAAVGLGEEAEVAVLVGGELGVEGLEEVPHVGGGGHGGGGAVGAVGEAGADGLVDVEHVGVGVPAVGVHGGGGGAVDEVAGAVFLEEADHAGAAGAAVEPEGEGGGGGGGAGFEEPEEHVCMGLGGVLGVGIGASC